MSLYKRGPKIYRAGFSLAAAPQQLPEGLEYTSFHGGKFSRFVLRGPFSDLPAASERVFEIVSEKGIDMRDDFCIEHYLTDPDNTPEDQTITHILIPTA
jgi:DNA gyrase inhibitor GyrI